MCSDRPNVMMALQKKTMQDFMEDVVDIGVCNMHKTHNAFSLAYDEFGSVIENLGLEFFDLFKNLAV